MLKRILSFVIIILMLAGLPAAAAVSYLLEYDADNNTYIVSSNGSLSVLVLEYGKTPVDLTGSLKPAFLKETTVGGEVIVDLDGRPAGKYTMYYKNGDNNGFTINYYNNGTVLPSAINSATSAVALKTALLANAAALGINENDVNNYSNLTTILYNLYYTNGSSRGFGNIVDFTKKYNSVLFCLLSGNMTSLTEFSEKLYYYQTSTGISHENQFENLNAETKGLLFDIFKGYDFLNLDAKDAYLEASVLSIVNKTAKWSDLMQVLTDTHSNVVKLNIGAGSLYSSLKDPEAVFKGLHEKTYKTISELKTSFEAIVSECYTRENTGIVTPPGGGGGSGGGGGGVSQEIRAVSIPTINNPENSNSRFSDMHSALWAEAAVNNLSKKNIIDGYPDGSFKPLNPVTRAEFTKMIVNAFNLVNSNEIAFNDVSSNDWFYEFVKIGVANNIIKGDGENFMPNSLITRQDAAVILFRAMSRGRVLNSEASEFSDNAEIADYAREAVYAMKNAGVINGVGDNTYLPLGDTSRAAAATMLYNALGAE